MPRKLLVPETLFYSREKNCFDNLGKKKEKETTDFLVNNSKILQQKYERI